MSIIIWLTWSKLASYQYGVFRAQKSHNAYSTVPVFKSCKIKSHTLEERHTLRPPRSPLDARLRWDGADPACLINSSLRKPSVRRITHTHTHTHSGCPVALSRRAPPAAALCSLRRSLSLSLPASSSLLSLPPQADVGVRESGAAEALVPSENSEQGQGQHTEICPARGGASRARVSSKPRPVPAGAWLMTSSSLATSVNISAYQPRWLSLERESKIKIETQALIVEQQYSQEGGSGKSRDGNKFPFCASW